MAKRTEVVLIDDIDGSAAVATVSFGLDGVSYEIDLNDDHAVELRAALASWISQARRADGRRTGRGRMGARKVGSSGDTAAIRAWAKATGQPVNERGRIPAHIREAYANR